MVNKHYNDVRYQKFLAALLWFFDKDNTKEGGVQEEWHVQPK